MTYSVWQSFITNGVETISGAVVSVFHEGSGTPAALFSSPSGGSIGSSVTSDSSGLARFYVAAGVYRITVTHASFSAEHRHVRIGEMAGVDDAPSDGKTYGRKDGVWEDVSASDYIPSLTVTVGTGGDYATWEAFYTAITGLLIGNLTVTVSGSHTNSGFYYAFPTITGEMTINFDSTTFANYLTITRGGAEIKLTGSVTSTNGIRIDGASSLAGATTITGHSVIGYQGVALLGSLGGTFTINAAATYLIGEAAGELILTASYNVYLRQGASATLNNSSAGGMIYAEGDLTLKGTLTYTGAATSAFIRVQSGARVMVPYSTTLACGSSGVTTVFDMTNGGGGAIVAGGLVHFQGSFSGTYTNKFSQAPNIITQYGVIFTGATVATYSKKTSTLTSSSGVVTIDCADGIDKHTITLSENVTSWSFTNRPTGADYIVKIVAVTQDASTARTCVSPATKTAGSAWTVSSTLSSEEWLELWIGASDVYLRASGIMV